MRKDVRRIKKKEYEFRHRYDPFQQEITRSFFTFQEISHHNDSPTKMRILMKMISTIWNTRNEVKSHFLNKRKVYGKYAIILGTVTIVLKYQRYNIDKHCRYSYRSTMAKKKASRRSTRNKQKQQTVSESAASNIVSPSVHDSKKINVSGYPVLKQKSLTNLWPSEMKQMQESQNKMIVARQKVVDVRASSDATEEEIEKVESVLEDAIEDHNAFVDACDYEKMTPEVRKLMEDTDKTVSEYDAFLNQDVMSQRADSQSDSDNDADSFMSSFRKDEDQELSSVEEEMLDGNVHDEDLQLHRTATSNMHMHASDERKHSEGSEGNQNLEDVIEDISYADTNANDDEDSEATPPRANKVYIEGSVITQTPNILPQRDLQAQISQAIKTMTPTEKIQNMVSNARTRAQAQMKEKESAQLNNENLVQLKISDVLPKKKDAKSNNSPNELRTPATKSTPLKSPKKKSSSPKTKSKGKSNRYSTLMEDTSDDELDDDASEYEESTDDGGDTEEDDGTDSEASSDSKVNKKKKKQKKQKVSMKQTTLRPDTRRNSTLLTLKLKVKKNKDSVKELLSKASLWLKAIQIIDPTVVLYQYHADTVANAIIHHKKIPKEIELFKKYFSGANPQSNEGHAWCQISMGHDEPISNIKASMQGWSGEHDTYFYVKRLQHKETVRDYFLLWSTQKMDTERLYEATIEAAKRYTNAELVFAFVWAVIRRDKGAYDKKEAIADKGKQYVRAIHVEVPRGEKEMTYAILGKLFGSRSTSQVLRRDLRMVPVLRKELTGYVRRKVNHLIEKQERYHSTLSTIDCYDLGDIDYYNTRLEMTLRDMIMDLKSLRTFDSENKTIPIFTSIDAATWPQPCHVLTFPSYLQSEAQDYISSLPSFLFWCYGEAVLTMMNSDAIRKAQEAPWDADEMRAITPESMELDAIMKEAEAVAPWVQHQESNVIPNLSQISNDFLFRNSTDADSVSTFHTKKSNREDDNDDDDGTRQTKRAKKVTSILNDGFNQLCSLDANQASDRSNITKGSSFGEGVSDKANVPPGRASDSGAVL